MSTVKTRLSPLTLYLLDKVIQLRRFSSSLEIITSQFLHYYRPISTMFFYKCVLLGSCRKTLKVTHDGIGSLPAFHTTRLGGLSSHRRMSQHWCTSIPNRERNKYNGNRKKKIKSPLKEIQTLEYAELIHIFDIRSVRLCCGKMAFLIHVLGKWVIWH